MTRQGDTKGREAFLDRRSVTKGLAAWGGLAAASLGIRRARAAVTLNYVGWEGYDAFLEAGDFAKTSGIALQKTFISSPDEINAKLRLDTRQVNICTPFFIYDSFLSAQGLIAPLDLNAIPNFQHIHPTVLKYAEPNMSRDGVWYAAPFSYGSQCMLYNAGKVEAPTSWRDLFKPEYKGKCAITVDPPGNIFAWARVVGVENPHFMTHEELKKTIDMMIELKKNQLRTVAASYGELTNLLATGEIVICQGWEPVVAWVGDKAQIKAAYPKEKSMGFIEAYAIGKDSPNSAEAHAIINHGLSTEAQVAGAEINSNPPTNREAMPKLSAANRAMYEYDKIEAYFTEKTMVPEMYPLEADGVHATWDDYQEGWERFLKS
jgi:spermidine/putrescine-binding protein